MRHVGTIAARDLKSLFVSPVAYGVLSLFSILGGIFFILYVAEFSEWVFRLPAPARTAVYLVLWFGVLWFGVLDGTAFIYFQF